KIAPGHRSAAETSQARRSGDGPSRAADLRERLGQIAARPFEVVAAFRVAGMLGGERGAQRFGPAVGRHRIAPLFEVAMQVPDDVVTHRHALTESGSVEGQSFVDLEGPSEGCQRAGEATEAVVEPSDLDGEQGLYRPRRRRRYQPESFDDRF